MTSGSIMLEAASDFRIVLSLMRPAFLAIALALAFTLAACASSAGRDRGGIAVAPPRPAPLVTPAPVLHPDFAVWLQGVAQEARADGISQATIDRAFRNLKPIPRVIELDHRQPEVKLHFEDYLGRIVTDARVAQARRHMVTDRAILAEVSTRYGVQASYIVALWGMETSFGAQPGNFPIIASLATLAYDGRRAAFFRTELIDALKILDQLGIPPEKLRGSWAGAMGQTQFMPSSFLRYAVDYTGDGAPDIWTNKPDVLASIANYLAKSGWDAQNPWGLEVTLPDGFDAALVGNLGGDHDMAMPAWQALGVRAADGGDLPNLRGTLRLVQPGGKDGPTYLVTGNYRALLSWNRSLYFATAASFLADRIEN
jgi:membrane-bound lytic murein transglycosylase B